MVLKSAKWCMMTHSDPNWTWIRRLGCICASCAKLSWQPSGWKLCWTCKQHVSSISATLLLNVTQNAFIAGGFHSKFGWCEWWTWRTIPPGYCQHGEKISRPLQPHNDGQLLLASAAVNSRDSQAQKQVPTALFNSVCTFHKHSSELSIYTFGKVYKFL